MTCFAPSKEESCIAKDNPGPLGYPCEFGCQWASEKKAGTMTTESYWKENDEYHKRQGDIGSCKNNEKFFRKILESIDEQLPSSILELGAGDGRNMEALAMLHPFNLKAVEINEEAARYIVADVFVGSIYDNPYKADLVLTKGLLIHIPPEDLQKAYEVIYKASNKYILICEYYNPVPVMVPYRGLDDKLWKRDFAGEMREKYTLKLIDYGFTYHTDGQDDLTWFLMEKA